MPIAILGPSRTNAPACDCGLRLGTGNPHFSILFCLYSDKDFIPIDSMSSPKNTITAPASGYCMGKVPPEIRFDIFKLALSVDYHECPALLIALAALPDRCEYQEARLIDQRNKTARRITVTNESQTELGKLKLAILLEYKCITLVTPSL